MQNPWIKTLKGPKWFQSDQNKVNQWFICSCLWMAVHGKDCFLCINTGISEWEDLSGEVRRGGDKINFKAFRDNTEIRNHTCKHRFTVYTKNRSKMDCKDKLKGVTVQRQQGKKKDKTWWCFPCWKSWFKRHANRAVQWFFTVVRDATRQNHTGVVLMEILSWKRRRIIARLYVSCMFKFFKETSK